ncbi:MAG TPA: GH92 family glycosyl hydrolase [Ktedonobacteraceae bacterium]
MKPGHWTKMSQILALICLVVSLLLLPMLRANDREVRQHAGDLLRGTHRANVGLAHLVDVFTGTGARAALPAAYSGGETFPGADVPLGMLQWSPDTLRRAYSGYTYDDNRIRGFSLTHLSGAGCSQYGDLPFLPFTGVLPDDPAHSSVGFSHAHETAYAGYYRVGLDNGVISELTVTPHSGAGRFTYPAGVQAGLLLNLGGSLNAVTGAQAILGRDTISGQISSGNFCYVHNNTYRVYFWAQFSQPFANRGLWRDSTTLDGQSQVSGPHTGVFVTFGNSQQRVVEMRVGISYVSVANARLNVALENPAGDFAGVLQRAVQAWDDLLAEIQVGGGSAAERTTFYTALYHALLFPSIFSDANGQYIGFDGQIRRVPPGHAQYTNFSGWDIYRSEVQLLTLLLPARASDMAQSLVNDYEQSGGVPKWPVANGETYVQVGDPAAVIISTIYSFGGTTFDTHAALAALIAQATRSNRERPGVVYLEQPGYEPLDGSYRCCNAYGPASTTLEYAVADFALSTFAGALGDLADARRLRQRAQNWRRLFNPATGYLQPRSLHGAFLPNFSPASGTGWVEGNAAQYTWMVPFDLHGLFALLGGHARVVQRLDSFFARFDAGLDAPSAFLGNEPSLGTPWAYDFAGAPCKTQRVVHAILTTLYWPGPAGLPGNEDLGELSSWFVFAALGMYPATPATASLVLATPLFPAITLHRPGGHDIQIDAPHVAHGANDVQRLLVNGQVSTRPWVSSSFVTRGGTLAYTLSEQPACAWGSGDQDAPPSYE